MDKHIIITISRQFGSGGHEIGKLLSKELGISFYDRDLITLAAKESGMSKELFESVDEKATNPFFYSLGTNPYASASRFSVLNDVSLNDKLFFVQADVIRSLAQKESCIIVGRCADYILEEFDNVVNVFIYAPFEDRVARISEQNNITEKEAKNVVTKTDKKRASYYNYYSGRDWGVAENYHLSVNSSFLGTQGTADIIKDLVEIKKKA